MLKKYLQVKQYKAATRNKKYETRNKKMKNLNVKVKNTIKVGNHPHTKLAECSKTKVAKLFISTISN